MDHLHPDNERLVVDVDGPSTWPTPLADRVRDLAEAALADKPQLLEDPDLYIDLEIEEHETHILGLLDGHLLRARHLTRLLDHEADAILTQGMRLLGPDLVTDRLDQAHARGFLTGAERETLAVGSMSAPEMQKKGRRNGQISLVLSAEAITHHVHAIRRLLTTWGGEAIYWQHCDEHTGVIETLKSLGRPALVTVYIDLAAPGNHLVTKSLVHTFVGKAIGNPAADGVVSYRQPIPPKHIESITYPGDPDYDNLPGLPVA